MRKGPMKQSPRAPEPRKPPLDFCPGEAWPKQAPGPPPIMNPVIHSPARPNSAIRMLNPSQLDGPTRGVSEAKLLVKYAADKQQGELSLLLKGGQNPNVMEKVEWQPFATTPLFEASVNGYKRIVRVLLEHGAKVDTIVGPGFTAVYNAALNGHFECTRLLVDAGANVGLTTDSGYTPLYVACQGGHADCVADLLSSPTMTKALADQAHPESGATALYVAAQNGHPFCVKLLLDAGVAVDPLMTEDGSSPCMIAMFLAERDADAPHIKIVELLLRAGCSLDIKNKKGESVLVRNRKQQQQQQQRMGKLAVCRPLAVGCRHGRRRHAAGTATEQPISHSRPSGSAAATASRHSRRHSRRHSSSAIRTRASPFLP